MFPTVEKYQRIEQGEGRVDQDNQTFSNYL